jgi:hypothetical protein
MKRRLFDLMATLKRRLFDLMATLKGPAILVLILIVMGIVGRVDSDDADLIARAEQNAEFWQEASCR